MAISDSKIEELRERVDIVDIIGKVVTLRKNGRNYKGLCPFHQEKTPSFIVSPDKKMFNCFGCHKGGDAIQFVRLYNKLSYMEAVQELAAEYNITLEYNKEQDDRQRLEEEAYYDLNSLAAKYYSDNLMIAPEGAIAREYLRTRQIKTQTVRTFGLGYATPDRTALYNYLLSKNADIEKAVELGLIIKGEHGHFDRFAGRIIFPLFSQNGRVIAFAGRIMGNDKNTAKYLNSPESRIYSKGRTLYGLFKSKDAIRQNDIAIVVEGYMDFLALYQGGVENVVAVSGTAFTDEQAKLLSRYSKTVLLLFDADLAGFKASLRSIEVLLKQQINIKISALPEGEDPDSYIRQNGADAFKRVIETAQNFLEYQAEYYKTEGKFDDPDAAGAIIAELMRQLALFDDDIRQAFYLQTLARKTGLREHLLENALVKAKQEIQRKESRFEKPAAPQQIPSEQPPPSARTSGPAVPVNNNIVRREMMLIKTLLGTTAEAIAFLLQECEASMFRQQFFRRIFTIVMDMMNAKGNADLNDVIDAFETEAEKQFIRELVTEKYDITVEKWNELTPQRMNTKIPLREAQEVYYELVNALNEEEIEIIRYRQKIAETTDEKKSLMDKFTQLHKEKQRLRKKLDEIRRIR